MAGTGPYYIARYFVEDGYQPGWSFPFQVGIRKDLVTLEDAARFAIKMTRGGTDRALVNFKVYELLDTPVLEMDWGRNVD